MFHALRVTPAAHILQPTHTRLQPQYAEDAVKACGTPTIIDSSHVLPPQPRVPPTRASIHVHVMLTRLSSCCLQCCPSTGHWCGILAEASDSVLFPLWARTAPLNELGTMVAPQLTARRSSTSRGLLTHSASSSLPPLPCLLLQRLQRFHLQASAVPAAPAAPAAPSSRPQAYCPAASRCLEARGGHATAAVHLQLFDCCLR